MGDRFGRVYYQSAVESYQFLLREYPRSKFAPDVLLRMAKLQQNNLGDTTAAMKTYQDFLKRFPRSGIGARYRNLSPSFRSCRTTMRRIQIPSQARSRLPSKNRNRLVSRKNEASYDDDSDEPHARRLNGIPTVKTISASSSSDSTRITIALEDSVQYMSGRIANPDRIYFDLHAAKLSAQLKRSGVKAGGNLVSNVRVAQNAAGVVRIVLDVNGVKDYSASLLGKPSRLVIDLYATPQVLKASKPANTPTTTESAKASDQTSPATLAAKNSEQLDPPVETKPLPAPRKELPTAGVTAAKGKDARGKSARNPSSKPE